MEQRELEKLLQEMSLEEKIGQMVQIPANILTDGGLMTGPAGNMELTEQERKLAGSILGKTGAEELRKVQEEFVKQHPHHIPLLLMYDVINGMETIFPIPLAQGCTFSEELVEEGARAAAREATASGLHVTFAPMLDLVRDARWGRVMESTGEDPWLNGRLGKAMVRGLQGSSKTAGEEKKLAEEGNIAGCVKHFAGYGLPDGGRDYDNVELSERTFREDYLPAYRAAIEEGCAMVMTSFNSWNRIPSTANRWLMRKVLREEMGFEGVLISDYSAVDELINYGIAQDSKEAAKLAIMAGVDIDMVSNAYVKYLAQLVQTGEVEERLVDEAVWRILNLKNDLGLFENPYKDGSTENQEKWILCEEHRALARKMAASSFVLLKNEGILPFKKEGEEKIAFIGPYADNKEIYGSWSFPKEKSASVTIREGVSQKKAGMAFAAGSKRLDENQCDRYGQKIPYASGEMEAMFMEALVAAGQAEKVVLCLGEHRDQSGEGGSRADISLPRHQMTLLREVQKINSNIVTVIFSGRPLDIKEVVELSKAVLLVWMPGTEGGNAIADVLFGDTAPEGRLAMSIPRSVGQVPIHYNRFPVGRPNPTGTQVCFIHGYIDESTKPLFPFGYGLTYTEFAYSRVELSADKMKREEKISAKVRVENTGERAAVETVQMYLRDVNGSVLRPVKMLRGVQKVFLQPGESREVSFEITEEMLRFYDADMNYVSEPGLFYVFIGHDSDTENYREFSLLGER